MLNMKHAKPSDRHTINKIMRCSLGHWNHSEKYINEFMNNQALTDDHIINQSVYLLHFENNLCGFFHLNSEELECLFLLPDFIGRGLGRLAWNQLCEYAKQHNIAEFIIHSQPGSEGFYLKMGCEKIGAKTSYIDSKMMIPILKYSFAK